MKTIILLFISFIFVLNIQAQEKANYKTEAVGFSFNGLNLQSYYGGIGGRFWLSDKTVISISLGGSISERKQENSDNPDNRLDKNKYFEIGVGLEKHFYTSKNISTFISSRLSFGLRNEYHRPYNIFAFPQSSRTSKEQSYNLQVGFGVEYWVIERISFSGQHLFSLGYNTGEESNGLAGETVNTNGFNVGFGTTSLMVSIYF